MKVKNKVYKYGLGAGLVVLLGLFPLATIVLSHCEIPCGIYDDGMRVEMIGEHIDTIEKSINEINRLGKEKDKNHNQLTRWIMNKENHADQLSEIVTQYFLTQRISPAESGEGKAYDTYVNELTCLHKLMVYSMKCKQTTDLDYIKKLRETLKEFARVYSEHYPERMKDMTDMKGSETDYMKKMMEQDHSHKDMHRNDYDADGGHKHMYDSQDGHGHSH